MKILYLHGIHAAPGPKVERLQQMKERPREGQKKTPILS